MKLQPTGAVDLIRNPKQRDFYQLALDAVAGSNDYRYLFYGGAIRGGKTFVSLSILVQLAQRYPNSRWHIFRRDFPALEATTIPSFQKIIGHGDEWEWHRNRSNYHVRYKPNDSKIFFKGENIDHDPDLTDLLGLETNGILYEQIEELSQELWQMGSSRLGSWYIEPMPAPLTLATFNPTQRWIKPMVHDLYLRGELNAPYYYMTALPSDNAYVTQEQWRAWGQLDERFQHQFIQGDWTDLTDRNKLWAYAFDRDRHLGRPQEDPTAELHLSFDFNRNPICCSVIQHIDDEIRVLETIKLDNSDIESLCHVIRQRYPHSIYKVTGDASGQNGSAMVPDNQNYYTIIRRVLDVTAAQCRVPASNPSVRDTQVLVNSVLQRRKVVIHEEKAKGLIYDMEHVMIDEYGGIIKHDRRDPSQQADALDTFRYWCHQYVRDTLGRG